jgi:hypothetical protein
MHIYYHKMKYVVAPIYIYMPCIRINDVTLSVILSPLYNAGVSFFIGQKDENSSQSHRRRLFHAPIACVVSIDLLHIAMEIQKAFVTELTQWNTKTDFIQSGIKVGKMMDGQRTFCVVALTQPCIYTYIYIYIFIYI